MRNRTPPAAPPPLADVGDRRSRWGWYVAAAATALAVGVVIGVLVLGDDEETAAPAPSPATSAPPFAQSGPCPADAGEQFDLDVNDPRITFSRDQAPTGIDAVADPADDSRATVSWTDVNDGEAIYVVTMTCTEDDEPTTISIGATLPGDLPTVTVTGLEPFNYCFSVFAFPTEATDDSPALGRTADGDALACLDE